MELTDAISLFLADRERRDCGAETLQTYRSQLGLLARWLSEHAASDVGDLCPRLLADYVDELRRRALSRVTVRKRAKCLRTFLLFLERERLIQPLAGCVPIPRVGRRLPKALSVEQVQRLLGAEMGARERAAISLMYDAGPRLSEVCALDLGDVDLQNGTALIRRGKGDKDRLIVFGDETVAALNAWLCERKAWIVPCKECRAVFVNQYGARLSDDALYRAVKSVAATVGLGAVVRPHVLRHTFATHALDNGAPLSDLQEQLGHEQIATTMIYASVSRAGMARRHKEYSPLKRIRTG